jgi:cytochrome bd ubiquinol oxidase subunit II
VPFHFDELQRPMYTGGFFSLLHPFALLSGLVSLSMLIMHGSTYASFKIDGAVGARASTIGRIAALMFSVAFIAAGLWVADGLEGQRMISAANVDGPSNPLLKSVVIAHGAWLDNYRAHRVLWAAPLGAVAMSLLTYLLLRMGRPGIALISSGFAVAATILTAGIGLFPFLMPSSTNPSQGLTVWDASSSAKTLFIMLVAVVIFLPIVLAYTTWVFRVLRGRITLDEIRRHVGLY